MENIALIKEKFSKCPEMELEAFVNTYGADERSGVKKLVLKAEKKIEEYQKELLRIDGMRKFEKKFSDCEYICGVDEVGRGPLAGPVYAGAVVLPRDCIIPYVNDSKKLTAKKREELARVISERAVSIGLGGVDNETIDKINILQATYEAMRRAVAALTVKPDIILVDALHIPGIDIPQESIIKGDAKSISIAAASIIAKVARDNYMTRMDKEYPVYNFLKNKGYGSKEHYDAINKYGICPLHRRTFVH